MSLPTGSGNFPFWQQFYGTSLAAQIGPMSNSNSQHALWLMPLDLAVPLDNTNFVLASQVSGNTWINSGFGSFIFFDASHGALTRAVYAHVDGWQFFAAAPGTTLGGGQGVIGLTNATTNPTVATTGGGVLYASAGALFWWSTAGVAHMIAAA
jgi:hypothetical protein